MLYINIYIYIYTYIHVYIHTYTHIHTDTLPRTSNTPHILLQHLHSSGQGPIGESNIAEFIDGRLKGKFVSPNVINLSTRV